jgi:hypothetical protein
MVLRRFGGVQFGSQLGRHLFETLPVGLRIHGLREALRPGDLLQQELLASGHGVILLGCSVPQTNAGRGGLFGSGNLKGSKTPNLQTRPLLGFSFRARRSAGARSSAMALVSSAPNRKICAE